MLSLPAVRNNIFSSERLEGFSQQTFILRTASASITLITGIVRQWNVERLLRAGTLLRKSRQDLHAELFLQGSIKVKPIVWWTLTVTVFQL